MTSQDLHLVGSQPWPARVTSKITSFQRTFFGLQHARMGITLRQASPILNSFARPRVGQFFPPPPAPNWSGFGAGFIPWPLQAPWRHWVSIGTALRRGLGVVALQTATLTERANACWFRRPSRTPWPTASSERGSAACKMCFVFFPSVLLSFFPSFSLSLFLSFFLSCLLSFFHSFLPSFLVCLFVCLFVCLLPTRQEGVVRFHVGIRVCDASTPRPHAVSRQSSSPVDPAKYPARAARQWIPPSIPPELLASGSRPVSCQSCSPVDPEYPARAARQWFPPSIPPAEYPAE